MNHQHLVQQSRSFAFKCQGRNYAFLYNSPTFNELRGNISDTIHCKKIKRNRDQMMHSRYFIFLKCVSGRYTCMCQLPGIINHTILNNTKRQFINYVISRRVLLSKPLHVNCVVYHQIHIARHGERPFLRIGRGNLNFFQRSAVTIAISCVNNRGDGLWVCRSSGHCLGLNQSVTSIGIVDKSFLSRGSVQLL